MLKLAYCYMRHYRNQTFAILASIILTAALLSGISSLIYSSQRSTLEQSKAIYRDWHYYLNIPADVLDSVQTGEGDGFSIEQCGTVEIRDMIADPYPVYFLKADASYLAMTQRELKEGRYPQEADEIAADTYTLRNLGCSGTVGDTLSLGGNTWLVTGILNGAWASEASEMELFVGDDFIGRGNQTLLYVRFREGRKLYRQLNAFLAAYGISGDAVTANDEVVRYLRGERPDSLYEIIKFALTDKDGNFTYLVLKLQSDYNLAFNGMLILLCLFSLFVIYSIFHISASQRISEYGIMQTLGISEKRIGGTLLIELWLLFLIGYPLGCLMGNGILKLVFRRLNHVFELGAADTALTGNKLTAVDQVAAGKAAGTAVFCVSWTAVFVGFGLLLTALAGVAFFTVRSLRRQSLGQAMRGDISFIRRKRRIYSIRSFHLVHVLIRKFMFSNKKRVIGIILSLSVGGCIFLCTTYMVENLKIHADMSMKSDDGLGSEYKVSVKSSRLSDMIPSETVDEIKKIPELSQVYATKVILGELTVREEEMDWPEYFDEQNEDSYFQQVFGGICVKKNSGIYGIKYDIYGYDTGMLAELQDFILEGDIVPEEMRENNKIIAVANMDGQGNYDFYGKHPGDTVRLKVPKDLCCREEVLTFQGEEDQYITKEFEIAAIASRALAQESSFLNVHGWTNMQSVILTNVQMTELFGVSDYSFVNASPSEGADTGKVSDRILQAISDVPKAILNDYSTAMETQKNYLRQQQIFFYGIAVILLAISLFHIANCMNYSILSRRREYGIIRAMGITDSGFFRMVLTTGILYGVLADLFIFLVYHLFLRRVMDYYMAHVVQFLHFAAGIPQGIVIMIMVLNLLIAAMAVIVPARKILKSNIVDEIEK